MEIQTFRKSDSIDARTPLRRLAAALASVAFLLVVLSILWADPAQAQDDDDDGGEFVNGEIVVKLDPAPTVTIEQINTEYGTQTKDTFLGSAKIYLLRVADGEDTEAKADRLEDDPRVLYAEPNFTTDAPEGNPRYRARGDGAPAPSSDPAPYSAQYAVGALNLSCANGINEGAGTTVAVLDTGAQLDHPNLAGSLTPGYDFIGDDSNPADEPNGLDDDGDTEVDEMTGHGTHVAGIVHLTAPEADVMPMRVLDSDGAGNVFVIAEAVQYAVNNGADVINMSLGASQESELLGDVTDDLTLSDDDDDDDDGGAISGVPARGIVAVASAGNENTDVERYPAAEQPGAISVTSVGRTDKRSSFANYSSSWVDISAPGEDVYSTFPNGRYASWDGTSMAAPFVAGQAALIRGLDPPRKPDRVENLIRSTARPLDVLNPNHAGKLGAGHADIGASLERLRPDANCKPYVVAVSPSQSTKDPTPAIGATVRDTRTNLTKPDISLYLDGLRVTNFSYDTATDRLKYTSGQLSYDSHKVKIVATDAQGLKGTRTWNFRVIPN